ncbi:MAG: hypothetical protein JST12_19890 [Armatimonadetes bacterium]|nr:hypothetical protein [Armatimonadota bacterium]
MSYPAYPVYKPSKSEWLGDIPEHWEACDLKFVATVNDEDWEDGTAADFEILYVDIGSVDATSGIRAKERMYFEDAPSRARRRVRNGDTIVTRNSGNTKPRT